MESARQFLSRGEPRDALRLLDEARRDYPNGVFAEEREALAIVALAQTGETRSARIAAESFRRSYPQSIHLQTIEEALAVEKP
jgi:outer membrane protein assembly factor BamD (BamD/ComL family)